MMRLSLPFALVCSLCVVSTQGAPLKGENGAAPNIVIEVDAREVSRALLHARLEIPAAPGELILWYPKWIPGVHAPAGPVQNLAGLRFETAAGDAVIWRRDDEEMNRFHLTVPAGADRVVAKLDYICNQPTVNSSGVDSFGNSKLAVINWNTVLLYPEKAAIDAATATVRLRLPRGWKFGTALPSDGGSEEEGWKFAPMTLRRVVDSPLICGEHFRTIELTGRNTPPAFLHLTSETPSAIAIEDKLIANYRKLVAEAVALFGGARFEGYHFLVVCSDSLPRNGLEHLASSFNEVGERELVDDKKRKSWPAYLLPHEFVHSWCGKFRRPASMVTTSFHSPEKTRLLWIYEGLTQYLGEVLTVRCGLLTPEENLPMLAAKLDFLIRQSGRHWRSLEDTAIASWLNRAHSQSWGQLRRGQDYYDEGLVVWLEVDALIRERSGGQKSLDDFCRKFFAADREKSPVVLGYELNEVTGVLQQLVPDQDWAKFFDERVNKARQTLGLDFLPKLIGYRLQYDAKPSDYLAERDRERKQVTATASIGIIASEDGRVNSVVPASPADKAGLAAGMTISGVNGRKFSGQRLKDGIADSVTAGKIELLLLDGETFRTVKLDYNEGPKYLELTRTPDHPDVLSTILKPLTKEEEKK
jgi:predicted metalloprotease with PDZ domain